MPRVTDKGLEWVTIEKVTAESVHQAKRLVIDRLNRTVPDADHALGLMDQRGHVFTFRAVHSVGIERDHNHAHLGVSYTVCPVCGDAL